MAAEWLCQVTSFLSSLNNPQASLLLSSIPAELTQLMSSPSHDMSLTHTPIRPPPVQLPTPTLENTHTPLANRQSNVHIAFIFSHPLVYEDPNGGLSDVLPLDFSQERRDVFQSLIVDNATRAIRFREYTATREQFERALREGATVLHFSGHGDTNTGALVFEDSVGCAELISCESLAAMITNRVHCVFVSSCYSQDIGNIFLKSGVDFVVCIDRKEKIMDEAASKFAKSFYHALALGTHSVPQAFEAALAALRNSNEERLIVESAKFRLLERADAVPQVLFSDVPIGKVVNVSVKPTFRTATSPSNLFVGRIHKLQMVFRMIVNAVAHRRRFITVKGTPCIGKHTLLRQLACYALDRQRFTDGVLQISLRGLTSVGSIFDKIAKTAKLKLKSAKKLSKSQKSQVDNALAIVDEAESAVLSALRDRNVLLVFENAEDAYINDRKAFGYVMKTLHDGAQQCVLLFASRQPLAPLEVSSFTESLFELPNLSTLEAAMLFREVAKVYKINLEKQLDALTANPNLKAYEGDIISRSSSSNASNETGLIGRISELPMLKLLGGHPLAIINMARLLRDRSLAELSAWIIDQHSVPDLGELQHIDTNVPFSPEDSLSISLQATLNSCERRHPLTTAFFSLFSMLPCGALDIDLDAIWPTTSLDWIASSTAVSASENNTWMYIAQYLISSSLIERCPVFLAPDVQDRKFSTFLFFASVGDRYLKQEPRLRHTLLRRCQTHFADLAEHIYLSCASAETQSEPPAMDQSSCEDDDVQVVQPVWQNVFEFYETNFRQCLRAAVDDYDGVPGDDGDGEDCSACCSSVARLGVFVSSILLLLGRQNDAMNAAMDAVRHLQRQTGRMDSWGMAALYKQLGFVHISCKDYEKALLYFTEALNGYQSLGAPARLGKALTILAINFCHKQNGEFDHNEQRTKYKEAMKIFQSLEHLPGQVYVSLCLNGLTADRKSLESASVVMTLKQHLSRQLKEFALNLYQAHQGTNFERRSMFPTPLATPHQSSFSVLPTWSSSPVSSSDVFAANGAPYHHVLSTYVQYWVGDEQLLLMQPVLGALSPPTPSTSWWGAAHSERLSRLRQTIWVKWQVNMTPPLAGSGSSSSLRSLHTPVAKSRRLHQSEPHARNKLISASFSLQALTTGRPRRPRPESNVPEAIGSVSELPQLRSARLADERRRSKTSISPVATNATAQPMSAAMRRKQYGQQLRSMKTSALKTSALKSSHKLLSKSSSEESVLTVTTVTTVELPSYATDDKPNVDSRKIALPLLQTDDVDDDISPEVLQALLAVKQRNDVAEIAEQVASFTALGMISPLLKVGLVSPSLERTESHCSASSDSTVPDSYQDEVTLPVAMSEVSRNNSHTDDELADMEYLMLLRANSKRASASVFSSPEMTATRASDSDVDHFSLGLPNPNRLPRARSSIASAIASALKGSGNRPETPETVPEPLPTSLPADCVPRLLFDSRTRTSTLSPPPLASISTASSPTARHSTERKQFFLSDRPQSAQSRASFDVPPLGPRSHSSRSSSYAAAASRVMSNPFSAPPTFASFAKTESDRKSPKISIPFVDPSPKSSFRTNALALQAASNATPPISAPPSPLFHSVALQDSMHKFMKMQNMPEMSVLVKPRKGESKIPAASSSPSPAKVSLTNSRIPRPRSSHSTPSMAHEPMQAISASGAPTKHRSAPPNLQHTVFGASIAAALEASVGTPLDSLPPPLELPDSFDPIARPSSTSSATSAGSLYRFNGDIASQPPPYADLARLIKLSQNE